MPNVVVLGSHIMLGENSGEFEIRIGNIPGGIAPRDKTLLHIGREGRPPQDGTAVAAQVKYYSSHACLGGVAIATVGGRLSNHLGDRRGALLE